jgi:type I restriction enzyme S subunit
MQRVELTQQELDSHILSEGDLLFARRSIVLEGAGKCALVGTLSEPLSFESSIIRVQLNRDRAYPPFFANWFQSFRGHRTIRRITRQGTIAGIASSDLANLEVPLPPLEEQIKLAEIVSEMESRLKACEEHRVKSYVLRQALCNGFLGKTQAENV